jgi:hypothetical protein
MHRTLTLANVAFTVPCAAPRLVASAASGSGGTGVATSEISDSADTFLYPSPFSLDRRRASGCGAHGRFELTRGARATRRTVAWWPRRSARRA